MNVRILYRCNRCGAETERGKDLRDVFMPLDVFPSGGGNRRAICPACVAELKTWWRAPNEHRTGNQ